MHYDVNQIKDARKKLGWNQTRLAFKCGLSVATVSFVESGKRQTPKAMAIMVSTLNRALRAQGQAPLTLAGMLVPDGPVTGTPPRHRKRRAA